jgi:hypothetical protein
MGYIPDRSPSAYNSVNINKMNERRNKQRETEEKRGQNGRAMKYYHERKGGVGGRGLRNA